MATVLRFSTYQLSSYKKKDIQISVKLSYTSKVEV